MMENGFPGLSERPKTHPYLGDSLHTKPVPPRTRQGPGLQAQLAERAPEKGEEKGSIPLVATTRARFEPARFTWGRWQQRQSISANFNLCCVPAICPARRGEK